MQRAFVSLLVTGLFAPAVLAAQSPMSPPRVLSIVRESVKPGKGPAHHRLESDWARAWTTANIPAPSIGIESVTGTGEAWFLT